MHYYIQSCTNLGYKSISLSKYISNVFTGTKRLTYGRRGVVKAPQAGTLGTPDGTFSSTLFPDLHLHLHLPHSFA